MAWLSAQTKATTVDGDYHSARRLPELTTRAVERLENSKYRGIEGIGSLQQFLTVPEKYHLKYVFSNDKFYDPLLYFAGWHRLSLLENGIMVWEKAGIAPLPSVLPREDAPLVLKLMWGIIPFTTVFLAFLLHLGSLWTRSFKRKKELPLYFAFAPVYKRVPSLLYRASVVWTIILLIVIAFGGYLFYVKNTTQLSANNVVTAYYDAVDFKEFERAHSYLDPDSDKKLSQFMLEISVSDGLLSSYAKLDSLYIDIIPKTDTTALGIVDATWITPLKEIETHDELQLLKKRSKWYIVPKTIDPDIPPEQLLIQSGTRYYNHGKRAVTSEQTFHEDVLKQPVVEVLSARLVQLDTTYAIVGEIQNVDNIPADISVTGAIYNEDNEELARYNAKDVVKHKLLPKETTLYRINFEGIAWASATEEKPTTYAPDTFTEIDLTDIPVNFEVQVSANVATTDLYQAVDLSKVQQEKNTLRGFLFNTSIEEATIPQLLIGYYNEEKELLWVESRYIDESVRQQRKRPFSELLYSDILPTEVASGLKTASVNGLPNQSISDKVVPQRNASGSEQSFIPIKNMPYAYITITTNNYVGNPK